MIQLRNKIIYTLFTLLSYILLIIYSKDNLLLSNLSRISNMTMKDYFYLLIILVLIGISTYMVLKRYTGNVYSFLGFISILIGAIIPYDFKDETSINCIIHTILAYVSFVLMFIVIIILLFKIKTINKKLGYILEIIFLFVCAFCIYLYGKYDFVNTLMELVYIGYMMLIQVVGFVV